MAMPGENGTPLRSVVAEIHMTEITFLTQEEVAERYRGQISVGTLCNWRAERIGPQFVKIGKAVLYPLSELETWDRKDTVSCRVSRRPMSLENDGEG